MKAAVGMEMFEANADYGGSSSRSRLSRSPMFCFSVLFLGFDEPDFFASSTKKFSYVTIVCMVLNADSKDLWLMQKFFCFFNQDVWWF